MGGSAKTAKLPAIVFGLSTAIGLCSQASAQSSADVEALQQQINELQRQLEALKQQIETAPPPVTEAPAPADAPQVAKSGNDKVKLEVSGQINRGILITDDSERTDVFFVDNDNSGTRLRFLGEAELDDEITAGTNFEVEFETNSTADVNQREERSAGVNNFKERKIEVYFDHERFGEVAIGQGDTASNGTAEADLSGTTVVGYSGVADFAGGILFRDDDELTDISIGDTFSNFDGLSRDDRIRYRTPDLAGLELSASAIADERYDAAARYSRKFGDVEVQSAAAYSTAINDFDRLNGSASVLWNGFSVTVAAGTDMPDDGDRDDGTFYYGKLGYQLSAISFGTSAFSVDYYYGEDIGADGDESMSVGVMAVQQVDKIAADLYAGYRYYDLDRDGLDLEPINAVLTGARIKF